jgi:AraC family transcriptional regulator of adaptative response/methylated-DNA-[protein]-cysteine methyltransferase
MPGEPGGAWRDVDCTQRRHARPSSGNIEKTASIGWRVQRLESKLPALMHNGFDMKERNTGKTASSTTALTGRLRALCRYIEAHADMPLNLAALGREAGISPFHLQRKFKAMTGVTPREYAEACRLKTLRHGLREQPSVTDAIHQAGYGSGSRVYERAGTRLGMTPGQYRQGGEGVAISWATTSTTLGLLMMAATDRGLCSVQLGDGERALLKQLAAEFPKATLTPMKPVKPGRGGQFQSWMQALAAHLDEQSQPLPELPLDIRGTAFQMQVWNYLMRIPAGELRSYTEVAQAIGRPAAVRAVASACAKNRIAIVVPCHRVIRGDGSLGGYRWGLERKRTLIEQERRIQVRDQRASSKAKRHKHP